MIADLEPYAEYKESGLPWLRQAHRKIAGAPGYSGRSAA